jgi:hypothetical protein
MKKYFQTVQVKSAMIFGAVMGFAQVTHAALPTWAATMGADLTTAIDDVVAAVGPVVVASLIAFITIKLIKRGGNKI